MRFETFTAGIPGNRSSQRFHWSNHCVMLMMPCQPIGSIMYKEWVWGAFRLRLIVLQVEEVLLLVSQEDSTEVQVCFYDADAAPQQRADSPFHLLRTVWEWKVQSGKVQLKVNDRTWKKTSLPVSKTCFFLIMCCKLSNYLWEMQWFTFLKIQFQPQFLGHYFVWVRYTICILKNNNNKKLRFQKKK